MNINDYIDWFRARYKSTSSFLTASAFIVSDFVTIMCCIGAGFFIVNAVDVHLINFKSFVTYWTYLPFFFLVYNIFKLYPGISLVPSEMLRSFSIANAFMFGGIALSIVVETDDRDYIAIAFLVAYVVSIFALPLSRSIARNALFSRLRWWGIPAVVYGEGEAGKSIVDNLKKNTTTGYIPVALVDETEKELDEYKGVPILRSIEESKKLNTELHIKMAIVVPKDKMSEHDKHIIITTLANFRYNIIIPNQGYLNTISMTVRDLNGVLGMSTTHSLTKWYNISIKRLVDFLLLLAGSVIVLPLMAVIAILIKLSSPGPVLYGHERIGKKGKVIKVWKFRSMIVDADKVLDELLAVDPEMRAEWDAAHKLKKDPRITGIGNFLRKTSLDELPQFYNILKGEMSFIGPRPVTKSEEEKYGENFNYIFSVTPGISGMWQVSGRSDADYAERVAFDSYYIQNWSLWLDIWLIFRTVGVVFSGKGAR
jgi:Undecaprenyl-phosphate galactose phosphotransferase WbaP